MQLDYFNSVIECVKLLSQVIYFRSLC